MPITYKFLATMIIVGLCGALTPTAIASDGDVTKVAKPDESAPKVDSGTIAREKRRIVEEFVVESKGSVNMTFEQKIEKFNTTRSKDQRLYCRRDTVTGSHKKRTRCITYAEKRDEEDAARRFFRRLR